jgi:hypothetical protein
VHAREALGIYMKIRTTSEPWASLKIQIQIIVDVYLLDLPEWVEGSGQYAAYPGCMVSYDSVTKTAEVYMTHDTEMRLIQVHVAQIATPKMAHPDTVYTQGQLVEVQTRVTPTDEYGWWTANVTRVLGNGRYSVSFYATDEVQDVDRVHMRPAIFSRFRDC